MNMEDHLFCVQVDKGDLGFGIYFTRNELDQVIVEDFVSCEDGSPGPAQLVGTIAIHDILEEINGVNIKAMTLPDVINQLRTAPRGLNTLTFKRVYEVDDCHTLSTEWWKEFNALKCANQVRWEASILSEEEFCDYLYSQSDNQEKSYLRHEYPTIMAHHQKEFEIWPPATLACNPLTYQYKKSVRIKSKISPSMCLKISLESFRVKYGWTRCEISSMESALHKQYHIDSAMDLVSHLQPNLDGTIQCQLKLISLDHTFPRLTKSMWQYLAQNALHALSIDQVELLQSCHDK